MKKVRIVFFEAVDFGAEKESEAFEKVGHKYLLLQFEENFLLLLAPIYVFQSDNGRREVYHKQMVQVAKAQGLVPQDDDLMDPLGGGIICYSDLWGGLYIGDASMAYGMPLQTTLEEIQADALVFYQEKFPELAMNSVKVEGKK